MTLPALREPAHDTAPPRRYLAPNVIALWPEDRPPVVNPARRGRYPRGVEALRRWNRLRPGVYAYLWSANPTSRNRGKVVRLRKEYADGDWEVEAYDSEIYFANGECSRFAAAKPDEMRRCPAPKGVRPA